MIINIDNNIRLELVDEKHSQSIFDLVSENKSYLRPWLHWVDNMQTVAFIQNFIKGSSQRNKDGIEYAFVIIRNDKVVGRIGVYKIDNQNKIEEIGYWVGQNLQGKGIVTKSCNRLIDFCFKSLNLNRIEIKCGTENTKSQTIPSRLHFAKEGVLRQAELVNGKFIDLYMYSLCKNDN
jgi:ribosomal-protein-serine acetyltransferase